MNKYRQILSEQKQPLKFLLSRLLMKTGLSQHLIIKQRAFVLRFYPTSLSAALWIDPRARRGDEEFFRRYLRPGDVMIDAGANIGSTALVAAAVVGAAGKVFAIEAHPQTFGYLQGNIELNGTNVQAFNVALGEREGKLCFSNKSSDDQNAVVADGAGLEIAVRRLDDLGIDAPRVALLKIDVEGYEKFVLQGAPRLLDKTDCVYFEAWEKHFAKYNYSTVDVLTILSRHGFQILRMSGQNEVSALDDDYVSQRAENLIAVRDAAAFLERTGFRWKA